MAVTRILKLQVTAGKGETGCMHAIGRCILLTEANQGLQCNITAAGKVHQLHMRQMHMLNTNPPAVPAA
jgi:hypothetical protein